MCTRLSILDPANVQSGGIEIALLPAQVDNFGCPQAMPILNEDHRRISVAVSVALRGLDELLNLGFGQVLAAAKLTVWPAQWANCSFLGGWLHQPQVWFCWHSRLLSFYTARTIAI